MLFYFYFFWMHPPGQLIDAGSPNVAYGGSKREDANNVNKPIKIENEIVNMIHQPARNYFSDGRNMS